MAAHQNVQKFFDDKGKTGYSTASAGITTLAAASVTFSPQELDELIRAVKAAGCEVVLTAGALKIRPKDSTL